MALERSEYAPHVVVDLFDINHTQTIAGCYGNSYILGSGPTPYGRQYALEQVASDYAIPYDEDYGSTERVHQGVIKIARAAQSAFAREVGFGYVEGQADDEFIDLTTIPTAAFVNSSLGQIYATRGEKPPLEFIDVKPEEGAIDPLVLVKLMSEGVVPLPTPDDKKLFSYYFADSVLGITRINHEIANLLIEGAGTVVEELESREQAEPLSEAEYRRFRQDGELVDLIFYFRKMAARLTPIGQRKVISGEVINRPDSIQKSSCVYHIADLLERSGLGYTRRAIRAGRMLKRLSKHLIWLENTASELQTA